MRLQFARLSLFLALLGMGAPLAAHAAAMPSSLTLFAEPGLKGRHATYRTTSQNVERQGFTARSAASTGVWTLCEGGEVASRCQTVDGAAPELKLSPQIVRPGVNALALYDQPGLKGRSVIYSFPADRPAPFRARSARTWGGPWSLCERGFQHCQTLEGRSPALDLVVAAVRPEPAGVHPQLADTPSPVHALHPARLVQVEARPAAVHKSLEPPRRSKLEHAAFRRPRHLDEDLRQPHRSNLRSGRAARGDLFMQVHLRPRPHIAAPRHVLMFSSARYDRVARRPTPPHLVRQVAERRSRQAHAARRRLYRRVRMAWGGPDPYLYDADPRNMGPPEAW